MGLLFCWVVAFFGLTLFAHGNSFVALWGFFLLFLPVTIVGAVLFIFAERRLMHSLLHQEPGSTACNRINRRAHSGIWIGLGMIVVLFVASNRLVQPPSDQALIDELNRREPLLQQIATIPEAELKLLADPSRAVPSGTSNTVRVSEAHRLAFDRLKNDPEMPSPGDNPIKIRHNPYAIHFVFWAGGGAVASTSLKGIAYLPKPPRETVRDVEGRVRHSPAYRHVRGNWYLYREFFPG